MFSPIGFTARPRVFFGNGDQQASGQSGSGQQQGSSYPRPAKGRNGNSGRYTDGGGNWGVDPSKQPPITKKPTTTSQ